MILFNISKEKRLYRICRMERQSSIWCARVHVLSRYFVLSNQIIQKCASHEERLNTSIDGREEKIKSSEFAKRTHRSSLQETEC